MTLLVEKEIFSRKIAAFSFAILTFTRRPNYILITSLYSLTYQKLQCEFQVYCEFPFACYDVVYGKVVLHSHSEKCSVSF